MHKQLFKKKLRQEMDLEAGLRFKELCSRIKGRVEELNIDKIKETSSRADMLMNLSCLVRRERDMDLIEELEMINKMDNFFIRLTGPWPPYSFAGLG